MIRRSRLTILLMLTLAAMAAAPAKEDVRKVTIKGLKYDPATLTIKAGQTVEWTNKDDNDHTVVSDEEDLFGSDNIGRNETFKFTFKKKGKFAYHCKYHPRMKGVIVVSD